MPDLLRTFIAVKVAATPRLKDVLFQLTEMGRSVKPVSETNLHVTLKFLGDTDATKIPQIIEVVQSAAAVESAFEMQLKGLGAFPHAGRPSVVWAGLEGAETLIAVAQHLRKPLKQLGFPPEQRPFSPHLTLARVRAKPPEELKQLITANDITDFGTAAISLVEFIQSDLTPDGPRYTVLASADLRA